MRGAGADRARPAAPLAPVALGLAAGVAAAFVASPAPAALWTLPVLLGVGAARPRWRMACWSALLGVLLGLADRARVTPPTWLRHVLPVACTLEGTVRCVDPPAGRVARFVLDARWIGEDPERRRLDRAVRVSLWSGAGRARLPADVAAGGRVRCVVLLDRAAGTPAARARSGAGLDGRLPDVRAVRVLADGHVLRRALPRLRQRAARAFEQHLPAPDAGLARALLLGDRSRLARADRDAFRRAGQAHLLAVSGVHVGLLLAGLVLALRALGCPLRATWLGGLVVAALYVPFTGAPASAVRAGLGAAVYFLGRLLGRPCSGLGVLALVASVVLLARPSAVVNVSFRLSFAAVLGIFLLGPRLHAALVPPRPVVPGVQPLRRTPARSALAVALAAWLGTAPFVALHIGRLCPAGAVISLAALPLAAALIAAGFGLLLLSPLPACAAVAAAGFELVGRALRTVLTLACDVGLGTVPVAAPGLGDGLLYGLGFFAVARGGARRSVLGIGLGTMALVLARLVLVAPAAGRRVAQPEAAGEYDLPATAMPDLLPATMQAEPERLALVGTALLLFAAVTVRPLRWLTPGGSTAAWVLGVASAWAFGWAGLAAVFAPFVVATLLGRLPAQVRHGPRTTRQVACNGLAALVGCLAFVLGEEAVGLGLFLGGLACLGADTCATEIGVRYGGSPFRLAGRGPIAPGESGGVTVLGLAASVLGAVLAPAAYAAIAGPPLALVAAATAAGVAGGVIDSVLGGTWQYRGRDPETGETVEARRVAGRATTHSAGFRWLDNDGVNLVSGLAAGLLAVALLGLL